MKSAATQLGFKVGNTYRNGYWKQEHTIVRDGFDAAGFPFVESLWDSGETTVHSTPFNKKRDCKI